MGLGVGGGRVEHVPALVRVPLPVTKRRESESGEKGMRNICVPLPVTGREKMARV